MLYIYVPQALLEDYTTGTDWEQYKDRFRAIEDYPDILEGIIPSEIDDVS